MALNPYSIRARKAVRLHRVIPQAVGMKKARAIHFRLPVSFRMVRRVVEQGQWNREKRIRFNAVRQVHPLAAKRP